MGAMTQLSARSGYQQVSVAKVSSLAGVSRATFYEQFKDKEDCLIAAYWEAARRVVGPLATTGGDDWEQVARSGLGQLFGSLQDEPESGRLLLVESRAAGVAMRAEKERALDVFEQRIEAGLAAASSGETLDIPAMVLVGGVRSIIVWRLRSHAQDELPLMLDDLIDWMRSYCAPAAAGRPNAVPISAPALPAQASPLAPSRLPRGRHRLPAGVVARSRLRRIVYGTAEVMMEKGYADATVTDIVAAAGISREVFYEHFSDKRQAFLEAQRYSTQEVLDLCATAFFSAAQWPERIWRALDTLIGLIISSPALAHLRLVECYAAGPEALSRAEDLTRSFGIFLEEGYSVAPAAGAPARVCSQAITGAIFEVIYRLIARGEVQALATQLPRLAYVALAPFTGRQEAIALVRELGERQVSDEAA